MRCFLLTAALFAVVSADRVKEDMDGIASSDEPGQVGDSGQDEWATVHDIDDEESAELRKGFHSEENCRSCWQGDILLPPGSSLLEMGVNTTTSSNGKTWPNGKVYYKWKADIHPKAKEVTLAAMKHWTSKTCVRFKEVTRPCRFYDSKSKCHPVVMGSDKDGCNAHAGYYEADWQSYNLGEGCHHVGTAMHELGHVLGLSHEHERFDRDNYVETNLDNVRDDCQQWFTVNPWRKAVGKGLEELPYDLSSIMHYDAWAFAINKNYRDESTASIRVTKKDPWGNCYIGQRAQLSPGDILTTSTMYDCGDTFCVDRNIDCKGFADRGMCPDGGGGEEGNQEWMEIHCPATCNLCECKDVAPNCETYDLNMCPHRDAGSEGNRNWLKSNCAKTCGICGPSDKSCKDRAFIADWGNGDLLCSDYAFRSSSAGKPYCDTMVVQSSCPRSCGACPAQVYCPAARARLFF